MLEIGSGANPTLSPDELGAHPGLRYTTNDIDAGELEKAGPAYERLHLDMATARADALPREAYDLVFSRMVNEHVADGERYYRNIFDVLRPGGVTAHCFSTLYALPFVANRLLPENLTSRLLDLFNPRDRYQQDKFPAHYSWSRGPSAAVDRAPRAASATRSSSTAATSATRTTTARRCGPSARWRRRRPRCCAAARSRR